MFLIFFFFFLVLHYIPWHQSQINNTCTILTICMMIICHTYLHHDCTCNYIHITSTKASDTSTKYLKLQNKEQNWQLVPITKHLHIQTTYEAIYHSFLSPPPPLNSPYLMYDSPPLDHYTPCDSI
eukprot:509885_1